MRWTKKEDTYLMKSILENKAKGIKILDAIEIAQANKILKNRTLYSCKSRYYYLKSLKDNDVPKKISSKKKINSGNEKIDIIKQLQDKIQKLENENTQLNEMVLNLKSKNKSITNQHNKLIKEHNQLHKKYLQSIEENNSFLKKHNKLLKIRVNKGAINSNELV